MKIVAWLMCAAVVAAHADPLSPSAQVGKRLFFDKHLSASGEQACSSCHDPDHAYGPPNDLAVQPGGRNMKSAGTRAVPSLRYQEYTPPYADMLDNPDGISKPGPGAGFTWDGRAPTLADQVSIPLLSANEMANRSPAEVVKKVRAADYADQFRAAFGDEIFADAKLAFRKVGEALQAFQVEDDSFHPYNSKYDLYASNKIGGTLTESERRGFVIYNDPAKGNCFACHYNGAGLNGSVRLFTDYTYAAVGVPRNSDIPANRDSKHFDLGICSRVDHPLPANAQYCGMFKTPTLRNVATRKVFFHNGAIKSLHDVIRFYNTRDTNPELWYPTVNGVVQKFNDLPPKYRENIDDQAPLDGKTAGAQPPMSEQDMQDLEAFINTLTDDYRPGDAVKLALENHLAAQGYVCLGKASWPIEVSALDSQNGSRDAVQMPVLEKLGIVSIVVPPTADVASKHYALTDLGKRQERHGDLCPVSLGLDQIVTREPLQGAGGVQETLVKYTYKVDAAEWTHDPSAQKVFPMLDRIIKGAGTQKLEQRLKLMPQGWVAIGPQG